MIVISKTKPYQSKIYNNLKESCKQINNKEVQFPLDRGNLLIGFN